MQELIQEHKNEIRATLKSWDNSVKIKGKASLVSILDAMDLDTSISVEGVNKKFSIWYNLAMLNTRSRNKSLYNYLTDKHTINTLSNYLAIYRRLLLPIYKVDDSLLSYFGKQSSVDKVYKATMDMVDENIDDAEFIFYYKDTLYYFRMFTKTKGSVGVVRSKRDIHIKYASDFEISEDMLVESSTGLGCNQTNCSHYKASESAVDKYGMKGVFCDYSDTLKCGAYKDVLQESDAIDMGCAINYVRVNRPTSLHSSIKRDDYEHLPVVESDKDVVIYIDSEKNKKALPIKTIDEVNNTASAFPSSHASPREHIRRAHDRREYTRKDGVHVSACKVGSCRVNKGHTKTTYVIKEHKGKD